MIVFESKKINTTFNSIPLENISTFDKNSAYISGAQRIYDNKIYEALDHRSSFSIVNFGGIKL